MWQDSIFLMVTTKFPKLKKYHAETLKNVKEAVILTGIECGIMLDTKGPEIRTGLTEDHKNIELKKGQTLEISYFHLNLATDYSFIGNSQKISCSYEKLPVSVKPEGVILIADGTLICKVIECLKVFVKN